MMKKFFLLIIAFSLLTACNLPNQQPTADPTLVENIVAMTLTAEYQQQPSQTNTPLILTPTLQPITDTPTTTPEATLTETPTASVTPLTTGLKDTLGEPAWQNPLDNGNAFGLDSTGYQDDNTTIRIENGAMVLSSSSIYGYRGWRLTVKSPDNIYLEGEFYTETCAGQDQYGLVFRAPDYGSGRGYYLGLTCDGKYNVIIWTDSGTAAVLPTTASSAIQAGPGKTNLLGIQMVGNAFTIYINNTQVTQFTDSSFKEGGHFGVFIAGQSPGSFIVRLNEIAYWTLQ